MGAFFQSQNVVICESIDVYRSKNLTVREFVKLQLQRVMLDSKELLLKISMEEKKNPNFLDVSPWTMYREFGHFIFS